MAEAIEEERQKRARKENEELIKQEAQRHQLDDREARMLAAFGNVMENKISPMASKIEKLETNSGLLRNDVNTLLAWKAKCEGGGGSDGGSMRGMSSASSLLGAASAAVSTAASTGFVPMRQRKCICVGGFQYNEGAILVAFLTQAKVALDLKPDKIFPCGGHATRCKIWFPSSDGMWALLKKMKGKKFSTSLADSERPRDPEHMDQGFCGTASTNTSGNYSSLSGPRQRRRSWWSS